MKISDLFAAWCCINQHARSLCNLRRFLKPIQESSGLAHLVPLLWTNPVGEPAGGLGFTDIESALIFVDVSITARQQEGQTGITQSGLYLVSPQATYRVPWLNL